MSNLKIYLFPNAHIAKHDINNENTYAIIVSVSIYILSIFFVWKIDTKRLLVFIIFKSILTSFSWFSAKIHFKKKKIKQR